MSEKILRHQDLLVYRKAFEAAMAIFEISRLPKLAKAPVYCRIRQ